MNSAITAPSITAQRTGATAPLIPARARPGSGVGIALRSHRGARSSTDRNTYESGCIGSGENAPAAPLRSLCRRTRKSATGPDCAKTPSSAIVCWQRPHSDSLYVRVGSRAREGVRYRGHCATGPSSRYCGHSALDVYYKSETGPGPLLKAAGPEIEAKPSVPVVAVLARQSDAARRQWTASGSSVCSGIDGEAQEPRCRHDKQRSLIDSARCPELGSSH